MFVFEEREKSEYPEKNLSEQRRNPTTNSTHIRRQRRDLNQGHIGESRALSRLRHPLLPLITAVSKKKNKLECFISHKCNDFFVVLFQRGAQEALYCEEQR